MKKNQKGENNCLLILNVLSVLFLGCLSTNINAQYDVHNTNLTEIVQQDSSQIYYGVEHIPSFPGGDKAMAKFIKTNTQYPKTDSDFQGPVVLRFVVEKDGSLSNVEVMRSCPPEFGKEAIRVIQLMPKWNPGKQNGIPVRIYYTIPIMFKK